MTDTDKIILPIEIYNKIMTYNIHPLAELIRKIHPITRIIKPIIKIHKITNEDFAEFYPDEQEFSSFSSFYMFFSNENPNVIHNNDSIRTFELGFTY